MFYVSFYLQIFLGLGFLGLNKRPNDLNIETFGPAQSRMRPVGVFTVDQLCCHMMEAKYRADLDTQTGSHHKLNGLFCITGDIYANIKIAPSLRCGPVRENCFTG